MKVLMLVNWQVAYTDQIPADRQPPDYVVPGVPYWFYRYMDPSFEVDVVDITAPGPIRTLERSIRFYIWQTLRALPRLQEYDLVVSHGMQSGVALALWRRLFGKGHYRHLVFDIGAFNSGRRSGRALRLMQFASRSLDGVIYHTPIQRDYYAACHPWLLDRAAFIPFGTDVAFFSEDEEIENTCSKVGEDGYILSFGKIKRDWDTLLAAYAQSDKRYRLRIIGPTDLVCEDPDVEILPPVTIDELKEQICGAAYCILPLASMPYSYGQMTLLQQMAMGKAVIAADVPSLAPYHAEGAVRWYPSGDVTSLTAAINDLAEHPQQCARIGQLAASAVREQYNEERMARAIEDYIGNGLRPATEEYGSEI